MLLDNEATGHPGPDQNQAPPTIEPEQIVGEYVYPTDDEIIEAAFAPLTPEDEEAIKPYMAFARRILEENRPISNAELRRLAAEIDSAQNGKEVE